MKISRLLMCVSLSLVIVLVFGATSGTSLAIAQEAEPSEADWTVFFYMDADNDLEASEMDDIEEMMAVGSTANVNLVMLVDRNASGDEEQGYTDRPVGGLKNWTTAKMVVIEKGKLRELADWGEVNMGDPATLTKFLKTAAPEFPSKHKALIFGDHGSGYMGIVSDESAGGDSLDMNELQTALKASSAETGKFDLIGFDACMMADFEAAKAIAPYGKTMVASEELEPGNGWDYTPLLGKLAANPQMDGVTFGRAIVDTFKNYYLGPKQGNRDKTVTLSEIDLDKIPALETAVSNLGVRDDFFMKSDGRNSWKKVAKARSSTEEYGVHGQDHFNYYDMLDFAENVKLQQPDADTVKAADAVIAAIKTAVIFKISGDAHPRSGGLTIYFPPSKSELLGYDYTSTPFSLTGKWLPFLADYTGTALTDTQAPQMAEVASTNADEAAGGTVTVSTKVDADDVDEATFVLAESHEDEQIIIGALPAEPDEKGILKQDWDGSWFTIGDPDKEMICPITGFEEVDAAKDTYLAEVPAQIRYPNSKQWHDVTLYFYLDFKSDEDVTGEFVYAFQFNGKTSREIDITKGDSIRPVFVSIDNKGESTLVAANDENDILNVDAPDDLQVAREKVAPGKYLIGFTVTDYSGNTSEKYTEVTVDK